MTRAELVDVVISAIRESQALCGRDDKVVLAEATIPIGSVPEFDSHNAIEVTLLLEQRLKRTLPDTLFVDDGARRGRSIGQVVDQLLEVLATEEVG